MNRLTAITLAALSGASLAHADLPMLDAATYGGSIYTEAALGMDVAPDGSVYVVGYVDSPFPEGTMPNAINLPAGGTGADMFVMKFSRDMTQLLWSRYVGGAGDFHIEFATDCAAVADGVIVTGKTQSASFPTMNAFDDTLDGESDAVLFKLDPDGEMVFSTYFGGSGGENGTGTGFGQSIGEVEVASDGSIVIAGDTRSPDLPLVSPIDSTFGGFNHDAFVARFSADGQTLLASTYLGDAFPDQIFSMALDSQDRPVIAGDAGPDWPLTPGAYQFGQFTSSGVVFITRLTSDGTALDFSAKIDGVDDTGGSLIVEAVAVTPDDRPVLVGWTTGAGFPVPSTAYQPTHSGGSGAEAYAMILSEDGAQLTGGTWLGRSITSDRARTATVNNLGQIFLGAEAFGPARLYHFNTDMSQILSDPIGVASTGSISMLRADQNQPVALVQTLSGEGSPGAFQESHPGGNQATPFITRWTYPVDDPQGVSIDLSNDAVVSAPDLAALIAGWGECEGIGVCTGDVNADGIVNAGDLAIMIASWGSIKSEE